LFSGLGGGGGGVRWGLNFCYLILLTICTHVDFLVIFIFKFKLYFFKYLYTQNWIKKTCSRVFEKLMVLLCYDTQLGSCKTIHYLGRSQIGWWICHLYFNCEYYLLSLKLCFWLIYQYFILTNKIKIVVIHDGNF